MSQLLPHIYAGHDPTNQLDEDVERDPRARVPLNERTSIGWWSAFLIGGPCAALAPRTASRSRRAAAVRLRARENIPEPVLSPLRNSTGTAPALARRPALSVDWLSSWRDDSEELHDESSCASRAGNPHFATDGMSEVRRHLR